MALVTTFMAGPLLRLLDPKNEFGAPVEEEFEEARKESISVPALEMPERSILLAPQTDEGLRAAASLSPSRWRARSRRAR